MSNVVSLHNNALPPQLGEPQGALIKALEDALEMAKSGRLQYLIATGFTSDAGVLRLEAGYHDDVYQLVGALRWMEHEIVDRITGEAE